MSNSCYSPSTLPADTFIRWIDDKAGSCRCGIVYISIQALLQRRIADPSPPIYTELSNVKFHNVFSTFGVKPLIGARSNSQR